MQERVQNFVPTPIHNPKALIPIAGKTILSFIVDQLHEAGINEFIFIVGYLGEKIQDYVTQTYPHLTTHFVHQNERQGTGHAIELTKAIVGSDEVFVVLGDTVCEYDVKEVLESPFSMLGIKKVEDPRNFGVASIGEDGFIEQLVEKLCYTQEQYGLGRIVQNRGNRIFVSMSAPLVCF